MALCMVHVSDTLTTGSRRASVTQHMCLDIRKARRGGGGGELCCAGRHTQRVTGYALGRKGLKQQLV